MFCKIMNLFKIGDTWGGGGVREVQIEQLRSWQLPHRRESAISLEKLKGGRVGALLAWPPQLPVHSSQRKFIILFRNM